jgi:phosphoheptose isomerase
VLTRDVRSAVKFDFEFKSLFNREIKLYAVKFDFEFKSLFNREIKLYAV